MMARPAATATIQIAPTAVDASRRLRVSRIIWRNVGRSVASIGSMRGHTLRFYVSLRPDGQLTVARIIREKQRGGAFGSGGDVVDGDDARLGGHPASPQHPLDVQRRR